MPFPSVRVNDETILDLMPLTFAERMTMLPGAADSAGHPVNHVCLSMPRGDFDALLGRLEERAVPVSELSYDSFGARGKATAASTSGTRTATSSRRGITTDQARDLRREARAAPLPGRAASAWSPDRPRSRRYRAAALDDPVTGHHHRQRIGAHRHAHGLRGAG
ncbi:hypothetical protein GCM10011428_59160 [Streptomyces violaceus]